MEPHIFRFAAGLIVELEAWRHGVRLSVRKTDGSLFGPVVLIDSVWNHVGRSGTTTRLQLARAEIHCDWINLLRGGRCFQRLNLRGIDGKLTFPSSLPSTEIPLEPAPRTFAFSWPARIEVRDINIVIQANEHYLRIERGGFAASELQTGFLRAHRITIKEPWLDRTFTNIRGTTALQNHRLAVADIALEPDVLIRSASADLTDLVQGHVDCELNMSAFGGIVRGQAQTLPGDNPFAFDASGAFTQIDVARLVTFLGRSEPAGGTIDEGRFTFRGAAGDYLKATGSLRLNATDFQWESRQWDSLVLGATFMDQRLRLLELELRQGANRLSLSGEIALQPGQIPWWQREFRCDIAANIDNLTDLSALVLPEFKFAAGKMTLDGSVRGQNKQFTGQLILTGSALKWRDAPIENLHAALKLTGNECRLTSIQFFNANDYVRGRGVVNILGPTQYWGELRASVDELGTYAALLQKPIVQEPLAGGAIIEWSGEGSAKGNSGTFAARLNKVRSLGALATQMHPIDAELEGYYAPGIMHFNKFLLADDDASFSGDVAIGDQSLTVRNIRLVHDQKVTLEGDALLPLDLWRAWPNTTFAELLTDEVATDINLAAHDLDLARATSLTGWKFPVAGIVRGTFTAHGPITALQLGGKLSVENGAVTCGMTSESFAQMAVEITPHGSQCHLANGTVEHRFGKFGLSGFIDLQNIRVPGIDLALHSDRATVPLFHRDDQQSAATVSATLDVNIHGPCSTPQVSGTVRVLDADPGGLLDLSNLWDGKPIALSPVNDPWTSWQFNLACTTGGVVPLTGGCGELGAQLRLTGSGADPRLVGSIRLMDFPAIAAGTAIQAELLALTFREGVPLDPTIELSARGTLYEHPFSAHLVGPLSHPIRFVVTSPPLTDETVRVALTHEKSDIPPPLPRLSLGLTAAETARVPLFHWARIGDSVVRESSAVTSAAGATRAMGGMLR